MEKHCEFCARPIEDYRRSTKKYCSDTCKQLSFYARQGMDWGKTLRAHNLSLCGKEMDLPGNEQVAGITGHPQEPAASQLNVKPQENSVKNASDNGVSVKLSGHELRNGDNENDLTVKQSPKTSDSVKENKHSPELSVKEDVRDALTVKQPEPAPRYEWVGSPLLDKVEYYRQQYDCEQMFLDPGRYWSGENIETVAWVTTRLHCLLVNVLRLSNYRCVDRQTIRTLSGAFNDMVESYTFRTLPYNYPFKRFAEELRYKFNEITKELQGDDIKLRLSLRSKAEMLCVRFIIGNSVPHKTFHQLKFTDGVNEEIQRQVNQMLDVKYGEEEDETKT